VLLAESAVLVHLKSVGIVLLVLLCVVVALLALSASQYDFTLMTAPPFYGINLGCSAPASLIKFRRKKIAPMLEVYLS
jgi:hypothetical protein